jgi:hypothetical protein
MNCAAKKSARLLSPESRLLAGEYYRRNRAVANQRLSEQCTVEMDNEYNRRSITEAAAMYRMKQLWEIH